MVVIAYYYYAESASAELLTPTRGSVWFLLGVIATVLQGEQFAMRPSVEAVQKILLLMLLEISIFGQIRNFQVWCQIRNFQV